MGNLVEFKNIADEITIRESDGVPIVTVRGAARLAGVDPASISRGLRGVAPTPTAVAKIVMSKGFEGVAISRFPKDGIPDQALGAILKYYAYKAGKHCKPQAEHACDQFQDIGIRAMCYAAKGLVEFKKPTPVEPAPEPSPSPASKPIALPPADVRLQNLASTMQSLQNMVGIDFSNPRVKQHYQDVVNNIVLEGQPQLPPSSEKWMGIVEFAESLGYKRPRHGQATMLGKAAKAWYVATVGEEPQEEERLVNGRMCAVKLYDVAKHGDGLRVIVKNCLG